MKRIQQQSCRIKIVTLFLVLVVIDHCWVSKNYSFAPTIAVAQLTAQALQHVVCLTVLAYQTYQRWIIPKTAEILISEQCALSKTFSSSSSIEPVSSEVIQNIYESISEVERQSIAQTTKKIVSAWEQEIQMSREGFDHVDIDVLCQQFKNENRWVLAPVNNGFGVYSPSQNACIGLSIQLLQCQQDHGEAYLADKEKFYVHSNRGLLEEIVQIIKQFIDNGNKLIYGTKLERIIALLSIAHFKINGVSYGNDLVKAQRSLYYDYFHRDGSICVHALKNMTSARKMMRNYPGYDGSHCSEFSTSCDAVKHKKCKNTFWALGDIFFPMPADFTDVVLKNSLNCTYQRMIHLFLQGDIEGVHFIGKQFKSKSEGFLVYDAIKDAYRQLVKDYEASLRDEYGILHFNLLPMCRDPLYMNLSKQNRIDLKNNVSKLATFNKLLIIRQEFKKRLQKEQNIADDAVTATHQALYALIDKATFNQEISTTQCVADIHINDPPDSDDSNDCLHDLSGEGYSCGTGKLMKDQETKISPCFAPDENDDSSKQPNKCLPSLDSQLELLSCGLSQKELSLDDPEKVGTCNFPTQTLPGFEVEINVGDVSGEIEKDQEEIGHSDKQPEETKGATNENEVTESVNEKIDLVDLLILIHEEADKHEVEKILTHFKHLGKVIHYLDSLLKDDTLRAEHKELLEGAIKCYEGIDAVKRCSKDGEVFYKETGRHLYAPIGLNEVTITKEQLEHLIILYDQILLSPLECGVQLPVVFDYKHIFAPALRIHCESNKLFWYGFHHDFEGMLRKSNIFDYEIIRGLNEHGIYQIRWLHDNEKIHDSTMFPDHWSRELVVEKIIEAVNNSEGVKIDQRNKNRWIVTGHTVEKIEIHVVLETTNSNYVTMVTAYPLLN